jgi:NMD protein affecting ribosome stability and mRNA decay
VFTNIQRDRHNLETGTADGRATFKEMSQMTPVKSHRHVEVTTHVLRQRAGVPYEVVRTVCSSCQRVLGERPLRRAAA